jgi:hypothetical protein
MQNYYTLLGVRANANDSEIKSAFRKLVLRYHPDKNPSPEAAELIVQINEAYEVLGDPTKRIIYDQLISGQPANKATQRPHRDPAYRKRPPNPNFKSKKQQTLEMMAEYLPVTLLISRIAFALLLFIALDFFLPAHTQEEVITKVTSRKTGRYQTPNKKFYTNTGTRFEVGEELSDRLSLGMPIEVTYSSMVRVPIYLKNATASMFMKVPTSIYGIFIFIPIVLLVTSTLGSFYKKGIEFTFNLGVINFILTIFTLAFLFSHKMI